MTLIRNWAPMFTSNHRAQGGALQRGGKVKQIEAESHEAVRAIVKDGELEHTVVIQDTDENSKATCTCPDAVDGVYCAHIWAVILDIKQKGIVYPNTNQGEQSGEDSADDDSSANGTQSNGSNSTIAQGLPKAKKRSTPRLGKIKRAYGWDDRLAMLRPALEEVEAPRVSCLANELELVYIIDAELTMRARAIVLHVKHRMLTRAGWSKLRPYPLNATNLQRLYNENDREICALLVGGARVNDESGELRYKRVAGMESLRLPTGAQRVMLKRLVETGRLHIQNDNTVSEAAWVEDLSAPLQFDEGSPWILWAVGENVQEGLKLSVQLRRKKKHISISQPLVLIGGEEGVVIHHGSINSFDDRDAFAWARQFREDLAGEPIKPLVVPHQDIQRFIDRLYLMSHLPEIELPEAYVRDEQLIKPQPCLEIYHPENTAASVRASNNGAKKILAADLWFDYAGYRVSPMTGGRFVSTQPSLINTESSSEFVGAAEPSDKSETLENQTSTETPELDNNAAAEDIVSQPAIVMNASSMLGNTEAESESNTDNGESDMSTDDGIALAATNQNIKEPENVETADKPDATLIRRDRRAETEAASRLVNLGFYPDPQQQGNHLQIDREKANFAVATLLRTGWLVRADHQMVYQPSAPSLSISSGIDWFELRGTVKYQTDDGEQEISLPQILKAIRAGRNMITLGDGSQGMLPEEWLEENSLLTSIAEEFDDHLRFKSRQAILLDHLLARQNMLEVDQTFERIRAGLRRFEGITPSDPNDGFQGQLRPYQRDGLGWLEFLVDFGIGGILADDMGLGKTVQMLSLIHKTYTKHQQRRDQLIAEARTHDPNADEEALFADALQQVPHRPTLVVAPKSVVFNWIDEAEKFAPSLRVLQYGGQDRHEQRKLLPDIDLAVTSFGLLRRDIEELRKIDFEYVVLDEAQAIKNPSSQAAKAARIVNGQHKLALTGTPVENHLGDLWSIFEFVNPGLLGVGSRFQELFRGSRAKPNNLEIARQTGEALRPFILRRTKNQVSKDLPDKTEQTIICEMDTEQRKIYDDLREHYRRTLLQNQNSANTGAFGANAMVVLEALLRLRQAACHPALIDPTRPDAPSAKMDALLDQLEEIIDQGHKALVFSQFTSMLSLVRHRMDAKELTYEYLDGKTRDRKKRVHRFQTDPDCGVFLISLKAGGLGLNLTAAEYVFILDPWWNPAVEAQAIDRAHRIGQTRHVFAYRLICKDTVEQRIAELQKQKREIADAIVGGQDNLLSSLSRNDLDMLLS